MEKPKIIVFTTSYHPFVGGAEIAIQEIAKRLKDRFDFYIVTARFRRNLPKLEVRPEGTVIRLGFGSRLDKWLFPLFLISGQHRVSDKLGQHSVLTRIWGVDIGIGSLTAAIFKVFKPTIPFILTIQYGYGEERLKRGRLGLIGLAFRFILSQADYVTAISTYLLDLARKYEYKGSGEIIHNGVDVKKFKSLKVEKSPKTKVVITTSRLVPKNGMDILIKAIAEVKKKIPDIQCWIIGDGPEMKNYKLQITNYKLDDKVKLLGEIAHDRIPYYLSLASIFVRPSRSEGMGNSFVEALSAGLPIIGTPIGGITDIIEDGKTGLFARPEDPVDLAQKIIRLLSDRRLAVDIVSEGQKMVEERFSWDHIVSAYVRVFQKVRVNPRLLIATPLYPPEIGGPSTYSKILAEELPKMDIGVGVLPFSTVRHLPYAIKHLAYFLKLLKLGLRSDIIYAQDPTSVGFPAMLAAAILRRRFFLKIVGDRAWEKGMEKLGVRELLDEFLARSYGFRVGWMRFLQKLVARRAAKIIVPSQYLKSVVSRWGVPGEKITVIPNAFEFPAISLSASEARRELGFRGEILISAGRLVPWKGFEVLIEVMPEVLSHFPKAQLFIIGSGPDKGILEKKIQTFRLWNQVKLMGALPRDEFLTYLKAGDVFVLNTGYEGFSHTLLEAMAAGTPIVTTNAGGNSEMIMQGVNGLAIKYNNREELKHALVRLLRDRVLRERLSQNAQKTLEKFSKEKMITDTISIFNTP